jgi:fumarylacetoacetase
MSLGQTTWREVRAAITDILDADNPQLRDNKELRQRALVPQVKK